MEDGWKMDGRWMEDGWMEDGWMDGRWMEVEWIGGWMNQWKGQGGGQKDLKGQRSKSDGQWNARSRRLTEGFSRLVAPSPSFIAGGWMRQAWRRTPVADLAGPPGLNNWWQTNFNSRLGDGPVGFFWFLEVKNADY